MLLTAAKGTELDSGEAVEVVGSGAMLEDEAPPRADEDSGRTCVVETKSEL